MKYFIIFIEEREDNHSMLNDITNKFQRMENKNKNEIIKNLQKVKKSTNQLSPKEWKIKNKNETMK